MRRLAAGREDTDKRSRGRRSESTKAVRRNRLSVAPGARRSIRTRETQAARRERAAKILELLRDAYPDADCALNHRSAFELLVAVILSAQCTDERVNRVTPAVFARYPNASALAAARQEDVEALIRSTGFFRNKAKNLIGMAQRVVGEFGGEVPAEMSQLLTLPGVARKTANCILGTWFGRHDGIVVDTHVGRLGLRLGLLTTAKDDKDAVKIERDLCAIVPREDWTWFSHALIQHGRRVCAARKPACAKCVVAPHCPSAAVGG